MTTWTVPATVARVVDADTLALVLDLGWHITLTTNARVAGIDAPELSTDAGKVGTRLRQGTAAGRRAGHLHLAIAGQVRPAARLSHAGRR